MCVVGVGVCWVNSPAVERWFTAQGFILRLGICPPVFIVNWRAVLLNFDSDLQLATVIDGMLLFIHTLLVL